LAGQPGILPDRLAAIGFCQGGIVALELARHGAPIRAAVGFHPGLRRPAGSPDGPITAKILMLIGEEDPVIKPEERAAFERDMIASGADWQLHVFGRVGHAYTDPGVDVHKIPGIRYDARADQRGWAMMLALLAEDFG
jgi:dienelactone hydrolase